MLRFVDLRGQGLHHRFAFWSTSSERFQMFDINHAWNTFEEFLDDYDGDDVKRYKKLCPEWVFSHNHEGEMKEEVVSIASVKALVIAAGKTENHIGGLVAMLIEELEALEYN
jgi:hypothetical protein